MLDAVSTHPRSNITTKSKRLRAGEIRNNPGHWLHQDSEGIGISYCSPRLTRTGLAVYSVIASRFPLWLGPHRHSPTCSRNTLPKEGSPQVLGSAARSFHLGLQFLFPVGSVPICGSSSKSSSSSPIDQLPRVYRSSINSSTFSTSFLPSRVLGLHQQPGKDRMSSVLKTAPLLRALISEHSSLWTHPMAFMPTREGHGA